MFTVRLISLALVRIDFALLYTSTAIIDSMSYGTHGYGTP